MLVSIRDPGSILLLKGNKPLELWYHPRYQVFAYASESRFLDATFGDDADWEPLPLAPMRALVLSVDDPAQRTEYPLHFLAEERAGTLPTGVCA